MQVQQKMNNQPSFGARAVNISKEFMYLEKETAQIIKDSVPGLKKLGGDKIDLSIGQRYSDKLTIGVRIDKKPETLVGKFLRVLILDGNKRDEWYKKEVSFPKSEKHFLRQVRQAIKEGHNQEKIKAVLSEEKKAEAAAMEIKLAQEKAQAAAKKLDQAKTETILDEARRSLK